MKASTKFHNFFDYSTSFLNPNFLQIFDLNHDY